jgi:hypothetical protein
MTKEQTSLALGLFSAVAVVAGPLIALIAAVSLLAGMLLA